MKIKKNIPLIDQHDKKTGLWGGKFGGSYIPETLKKPVEDLTNLFEKLRKDKGSEDGLMLPEHIADTYFHIAQQHRSVWTHELDLRSFSDEAWWNHAVNIEF